VVEGTGSVDSRFPRHAPPLPLPDLLFQLKNLTASPFMSHNRHKACSN
jgi:hypothetical protein